MYVSIRDIASLATIMVFMTALFTWSEILNTVA